MGRDHGESGELAETGTAAALRVQGRAAPACRAQHSTVHMAEALAEPLWRASSRLGVWVMQRIAQHAEQAPTLPPVAGTGSQFGTGTGSSIRRAGLCL